MLPGFFRGIGSDSSLTYDELSLSVDAHALTVPAWDLYRRHFRGFTGSTLDPQFHRLTHPATSVGTVRLDPNETVVVVGTGPSLAANIETLKRLRHHVRVFTSPRGADTLLRHGITPDLVLVEHQTALDAHTSARHLDDAGASVLSECPLVAADWRTPRSMLSGVAGASLFVPDSLPTWGLWPATALAMAAEAGASRLALLGIDLGTPGTPDPAHEPLRTLLELLAALVIATTTDCGASGAAKRGWQPARLDEVAGDRITNPIETRLAPAPGIEERADHAHEAMSQLHSVIERAAQLRSIALRARSGGHVSTRALQSGVDEILSWRHDRRTRLLVQECLGASFLPRFWRIGVDLSLGPALWRPLLLATDELTAQADTLTAMLTTRRAGPFGPADRAA
jgi:hypothetical protein